MTQPDVASPPAAAAGTSEWPASRIAAAVIGAVLILLGLALLGGGGTALWADRTQRDGGYVTTGVHEFSTSGSALVTVSTDLGSTGTGWLYSPTLLDTVRIRVTPMTPHPAVFVGIGRTTDVDRYLAGASRTVITDFWDENTEVVDGAARPAAPATQDFWVASASGHGAQDVVWDPADGSWSVVVMNADGRPGLEVEADLGAKLPALPWVALGVLAAGAIVAGGGGLLVAGALRRRPVPTR